MKEHFDVLEEFDEAITRQFEKLIRIREDTRLTMEEKFREHGQEWKDPPRKLPQTTGNIQIVPPRSGDKRLDKIAQRTSELETPGSDGWFKVVRRRGADKRMMEKGSTEILRSVDRPTAKTPTS